MYWCVISNGFMRDCYLCKINDCRCFHENTAIVCRCEDESNCVIKYLIAEDQRRDFYCQFDVRLCCLRRGFRRDAVGCCSRPRRANLVPVSQALKCAVRRLSTDLQTIRVDKFVGGMGGAAFRTTHPPHTCTCKTASRLSSRCCRKIALSFFPSRASSAFSISS
jgi:hypothetical protein